MLLLEKQNIQIDKLTEIMGVNELDERTQQNIKTCLLGIIVEDKEDRLKSLFKVLLGKMGADKLSEDIQTELTLKILDACQYIRDGKNINKAGQAINDVMKISDFKWNSNAESPVIINEVKKTDFKWKKTGDPSLLENTTEKVKKSSYRWGADSNSMGSHIKGTTI